MLKEDKMGGRSLSCSQCQAALADHHDCCFFQQSPTATHLIFKPEISFASTFNPGQVTKLDPGKETSKKRKRGAESFFCKGCGSKVGSIVKIGPQNEAIWCFSYDFVVTTPTEQKIPKGTWHAAIPFLNGHDIPVRNANEFIGNAPVATERVEPPPMRRHQKLTDLRGLGKEFFAQLNGYAPRPYQLEMFLHAAVQDVIMVMPTGSGKTLIAAMLLLHWSQMNPKRIGVFVVDKVPLAYQQAEQIRRYTGLRVYELCGENTFDGLIAKVFPEKGPTVPHVVVITAQCYFNILDRGLTRISEAFAIVFDEVHHLSGNHPYHLIMSNFISLEKGNARPALIGLTASPGGKRTEDSTISNVEMLSMNFLSSPIITPSLRKTLEVECLTNYILYRESSVEIAYSILIAQHFYKVLGMLANALPPSFPKVLEIMTGGVRYKLPNYSLASSLKVVKKRQLWLPPGLDSADFKPTSAFELSEILCDYLLSLYEITFHAEVAGLSSSARHFEKSLNCLLAMAIVQSNQELLKVFSEIRAALQEYANDCVTTSSSKVDCLMAQLKNLNLTSSFDEFRGIVFVRQRKTAFLLAEILKKDSLTSKLRPTPIVGQGGFEGMSWQDSQQHVLQSFRAGLTKLLVATTVLEEGIDVPACNVVIHFDEPLTSTSFLQSRGRMRDLSGSFIVIGTEDIVAKVKGIEAQLGFISSALGQFRSKLRVANSDALKTVDSWSTALASTMTKTSTRPDPIVSKDNTSFCCVKVIGSSALSYSYLCNIFEIADATIEDAHFSGRLASTQLRPSLKWEGKKEDWYAAFVERVAFNPDVKHMVWTRLCGVTFSAQDDNISQVVELPVVHAYRGCFSSLHTFNGNRLPSKPLKFCFDIEAFVVFFDDHRWEIPYSSFYSKVVVSRSEPGTCDMFLTPLLLPFSLCGEKTRLCIQEDRGPWQLCLRLDESSLSLLRKALNSLPIFEVYDGRILVSDLIEMQSSKVLENCDATMALDKLWSRYTFMPSTYSDRLYELLGKFEPSHVATHTPNLELVPFVDIVESIEKQLKTIVAGDMNIPANFAKIPMWYITPSRILYGGEILIQMSRVLRQFKPENFILVHFRDENLEVNTNPAFLERICDILAKGFELPYSVPHARYHFAGSSNSGRKAATAWFTSTLDPKWIWSQLGDFSSCSSNKFKQLSRIGLAFASSVPTIELETSFFADAALDVDIIRNNKNFSDGIGGISLEYAKVVAESYMNWNFIPTALQIRVGGLKGVVTVTGTESCPIRFRPSMKKFESNHNQLEVLNYSQYLPLYLNRQVISILNSLGVQNSTFSALQDEFLETLLDNISGRSAERRHIVMSSYGMDVSVLETAGVNIVEEPFFSSLLRAHYLSDLSNLITRARILIPKGANLMGILDETNTLKYGQVFVRMSGAYAIQGKLLLYRNPATHPGDIRVLEAVNVEHPWFESISDVIVFPAQGNRPHPDECGNGDLDGDLYACCWDERLFPINCGPYGFPPLELDEAEILRLGGESLPTDLADAYSRLLGSDSDLGQIASAHLARSDYDEDGARSEKAIALSKLHVLQVDFPKTGISAPLDEDLPPKAYPHFMEKKRESYVSSKALGILYDKAVAFTELLASANGVGRLWRLPWQLEAELGKSEIFKLYKPKAENRYRTYKQKIQAVLNAFGLSDEAELIIGKTTIPKMRKTRGNIRDGRKVFENLASDFVQCFYEDLADKHSTAERQLAAAAWYLASYNDNSSKTALSFPWLIKDEMLALFNQFVNRPSHHKPQLDLADAIGSSVAELFSSMRFEILSDYTIREHARSDLEVAVQSNNSSVALKMFGSSAIPGLADSTTSDIDICMVLNVDGNLHSISAERQLKFLEDAEDVCKKLRPNQSNAITLAKTAKVPVLRILSSSGEDTDVDIVAHINGIWKALFIKNCIISNRPEFYVALIILMKWARQGGLIGHEEQGGGRSGLFTAFGFSLFLIKHLKALGLAAVPADIHEQCKNLKDDTDWEDYVATMVDLNTQILGCIISGFFHKLSEVYPLGEPVALLDPFDSSRESVTLSVADVAELHKRLSVTLHSVALSGGNFRLASGIRQQIMIKKVPVRYNRSDKGVVEYFRDYILWKAKLHPKADIDLKFLKFTTEGPLRRTFITFQITGDGRSVEAVVKAMDSLRIETHSALNKRNYKAFAEGSNSIFFEGSIGDSSIGIAKYLGHRHNEHAAVPLHTVSLLNPILDSTWFGLARTKLRSIIYNQCDRLLHSGLQNLRHDIFQNFGIPRNEKSLSIATLCIRFGRFYVINLPRSFEYRKLKDAQISDLEASFEMRHRQVNDTSENMRKMITQEEKAWDEVAAGVEMKTTSIDSTEMKTERHARRIRISEVHEGSGTKPVNAVISEKAPPSKKDMDKSLLTLTTMTEEKKIKETKGATSSILIGTPCSALDLQNLLISKFGFQPDVVRSKSLKLFVKCKNLESQYKIDPITLKVVHGHSRPRKWISATLITEKGLRAESGDSSISADAIPDARLYLDTKVPIPLDHEFHPSKLEGCFADQPHEDNLNSVDIFGPAPILSQRLRDALEKVGEHDIFVRQCDRLELKTKWNSYSWKATIAVVRNHRILRKDGSFLQHNETVELKLKLTPPIDENGQKRDLLDCLGDPEFVQIAADGLLNLGPRIAVEMAGLPQMKKA
ncbi:Interferon-induced helicase C domain-containing protein 1 [Phlyctochytrium planicorne]|nr:Interferon-induced helicase C domain-containing protein 1 [Phlyctochytrium planicorne]